jgi:CHAT domain-containing protein
MVGFYRNLKKGMSKNKALHQAKLDYLEENTNVNSHPFFWAGFIPVGDMSPIAF